MGKRSRHIYIYILIYNIYIIHDKDNFNINQNTLNKQYILKYSI